MHYILVNISVNNDFGVETHLILIQVYTLKLELGLVDENVAVYQGSRQ